MINLLKLFFLREGPAVLEHKRHLNLRLYGTVNTGQYVTGRQLPLHQLSPMVMLDVVDSFWATITFV